MPPHRILRPRILSLRRIRHQPPRFRIQVRLRSCLLHQFQIRLRLHRCGRPSLSPLLLSLRPRFRTLLRLQPCGNPALNLPRLPSCRLLRFRNLRQIRASRTCRARIPPRPRGPTIRPATACLIRIQILHPRPEAGLVKGCETVSGPCSRAIPTNRRQIRIRSRVEPARCRTNPKPSPGHPSYPQELTQPLRRHHQLAALQC